MISGKTLADFVYAQCSILLAIGCLLAPINTPAKEGLDVHPDRLQDLLAPFAKIRHIKLAYHEQRSSVFLKQPRQFHGYIEYISPDQFSKQIDTPVNKKFAIKSNRLTITTEASANQPASSRIVPLDDYPQFRQFKALFLGLLAGDAAKLSQYYRYQITSLPDGQILLTLKSLVRDAFIEPQQNISHTIEITFKQQQITTITMFGFTGEKSELYIDSILTKDVSE